MRGVSFEVARGETIALVGESGCGKSSTARLIAGLETATSGSVSVAGHDIADIATDKRLRRLVQMVFQHSDQALDRSWNVERIVAEPLLRMDGLRLSAARTRTVAALNSVGLGDDFLSRRPRELSGGQSQRVAIARALISQPELVVLDEPTASLDQSVRTRVLDLLKRIQEERNVGYVFISHDLASVRRIADRVAVMYLGRIVEIGRTAEIFANPRHPYTQGLLRSEPPIDPAVKWEITPMKGETPSASAIPDGCAFRGRCPIADEACATVDPLLLPVGSTRQLACIHRSVDGPI
ncbi:oligopeptide/dipeptide ABC transporter ATP-binding protein [Homoserinimonas sp. OAct 916]|uniref:oligopeptide/dipeptide ABC transporter ATP-binding protein n=1 Tax=Homoserinimonas sp. OAct 916 TaxID=2211450 RepID=UPI0034CFABCF